MDIFGGIEKLITEHGSAAILKERLLLVADKYAALEKALADSQAKTKDAISQKEHFELESMKLKEELRRVNKQLLQFHDNPLTSKYGVLWDKHGNPQCPRCKATITRVDWAVHINEQVQALQCSCSETPIVLMEAGEPVQAPEAMRLMARG